MADSDQNLELSPELQAVYDALLPAERRIMQDGSRADLIKRLERYRGGLIAQDAKATAREITAEVAPDGQLPPLQDFLPYFSAVPRDFCRVSPFFPIARQQLGDRPWIERLSITTPNQSWGRILYSGPKLSTIEEDVLYAILRLMQDKRHTVVKDIYETADDQIERTTYVLHTHMRSLMRGIGYKFNPGGRDYERTLRAVELMSSAVLRMEIFMPSAKKSVKKRRLKRIDINNIISHMSVDNETQEISITINPYFYETYCAGAITYINMEERMKLSSPVSRALHRFVSSHQELSPIHIHTLAAALNLPDDMPDYKIRAALNRAIKEMIKIGVLGGTSKIARSVAYLFKPVKPGRAKIGQGPA